MNETKSALPAKIGGAEITRFNALRHGVLSRYTVLPWERCGRISRRSWSRRSSPSTPCTGRPRSIWSRNWRGVLWRKRRLRLVEAAAHRHGLDEDALSESHRKTAKSGGRAYRTRRRRI